MTTANTLHTSPSGLYNPAIDFTDPRTWYCSDVLANTDSCVDIGNGASSWRKAGVPVMLPPLEESNGDNSKQMKKRKSHGPPQSSSGNAAKDVSISSDVSFSPRTDGMLDLTNTINARNTFLPKGQNYDSSYDENISTSKYIAKSLPNMARPPSEKDTESERASKARSEKLDPFNEFFRTATENKLEYARKQVELEKHKQFLIQNMVDKKEQAEILRKPKDRPNGHTWKMVSYPKQSRYDALRLPQKPCDKERELKFRQGYIMNLKSNLKLAIGGRPPRAIADIQPNQDLHVHIWEKVQDITTHDTGKPTKQRRIRFKSEESNDQISEAKSPSFCLESKVMQPEDRYESVLTESVKSLRHSEAGKDGVNSPIKSAVTYSSSRASTIVGPRKEVPRAAVVNLYLQQKLQNPTPRGTIETPSGTEHRVPTAGLEGTSENLPENCVTTLHPKEKNATVKYTNLDVFGENKPGSSDMEQLETITNEEEIKSEHVVPKHLAGYKFDTSTEVGTAEKKRHTQSTPRQKELAMVTVGQTALPPVAVSRRQTTLYEKLLKTANAQKSIEKDEKENKEDLSNKKKHVSSGKKAGLKKTQASLS